MGLISGLVYYNSKNIDFDTAFQELAEKKKFNALDLQTGEKLKTSSAKVREVFPSFTGQEGV